MLDSQPTQPQSPEQPKPLIRPNGTPIAPREIGVSVESHYDVIGERFIVQLIGPQQNIVAEFPGTDLADGLEDAAAYLREGSR